MKKKLLIMPLFLMSIQGYSQLEENTFSFDYTLAPVSNDGIDYTKTDFRVSIPTKLKKGTLFNSIDFGNYNFGYINSTINTEDLERFSKTSYTLKYLYPIGNKWSLSAQAGASLTSNFAGSITSEDVTFNGGISTIKKGGTKEKLSIFKIGLNYSTISGKPRVLPIISYSKRLGEKFSYSIGFPSTYAQYSVNDRSSFKTLLKLDGFYANLSNPVNLTSIGEVKKDSFSAISLGLDYDCRMDEWWSITFSGGYSFHNTYELLDINNNTLYDFNLGSKPYFSSGVKFNLKNKTKNKNRNDEQ